MLRFVVQVMAAFGFYRATKKGKNLEESARAGVKSGCLGVILYFVLIITALVFVGLLETITK
jgi:hypothetical protein